MKLVDANVLLYAINERSAHHEAARRWLDEALGGAETVGFAWLVILAFVRLSTHPAVFPRPLATEESIVVVEDWLAQPGAIVVEPTDGHVAVLGRLLSGAGTAGNLVNDAHLAALALEHSAEIVSFDADFSRFAGVRWQPPA
jgi:Predicted nucleic acid-binding protein, contains PIN domain